MAKMFESPPREVRRLSRKPKLGRPRRRRYVPLTPASRWAILLILACLAAATILAYALGLEIIPTRFRW